MIRLNANLVFFQFGGSPIKVGEDEYHLFRDSEYVPCVSIPA
jgi:hypothetical protein